jgi:uncharacterized protein involved in type VI secretion and phage assembly
MSSFFFTKVVDNKDPDELNRVKVLMIGESDSACWVPYLTPQAGDGSGMSILPNLEDQVLVVSLDMHKTRLVAVGGIWFEKQRPPETGTNAESDHNADGQNSLKFIKSQSGNIFLFDDSEGKEKFLLITADGSTCVEFNTPDKSINVNTRHDVTIGAKGKISIQADEIQVTGKKELLITTENLKVSSKNGFETVSEKDFTIKGAGLTLN